MEKNYRDVVGKYLEIGKEMAYLSLEDVSKSAPTKIETINLMEETLQSHGKNDYVMPPKVSIRVSGTLEEANSEPYDIHGGFAAKPAFIKKGSVSGVKWISGFPDSRDKFGLPQTSGLTILSDTLSGIPLAVMDATWLTAERTAAVTMVGIKHLAKESDETFGMIGCGAVGTKHVEYAPYAMPNLKKIYIYDIYESAMDHLIKEVQPKTDIEIIKATSYEELVKSSDVFTSAVSKAPDQQPEIKDQWITPGQTLFLCSLIDLYEDVTLKRADKYIVDSIEDHEEYEKRGSYPKGIPSIHSELGEVVAGMKPGRETEEEIIISCNVGMAIEDMALSAAISKKALINGLGQKLKL